MQSSLWLLLFVCTTGGPFTRGALRIAAAGSVLLAISGAFLFARLPWTAPGHVTPPQLPPSVEQLAKAPSDSAADLYDALQRGDFTKFVFPTGIVTNGFNPQ